MSEAAPPDAAAQIARLVLDYNRCIDDEQYERWPDLFTEKCLYQVISATDHALGRPSGFVYCDSRDMLIDRVRSIRTVNVFEPHRYRHLTGASSLRRIDPSLYEARTAYMVARIAQDGATDLFSTGEYRDEIEFGDGNVLFRSRLVLCDSPRISNLLVIPL